MNSPEYLRISLAAAMELGFVQGFFYRGARLHCINLLLTYQDGCKANCAFCGLSRERTGLYPDKKFIRVDWPTRSTAEIIDRLKNAQEGKVVQRVCLSMITHRRAVADGLSLAGRLTRELTLPLSMLITPTLMDFRDLIRLRETGVDRIGVAIDCATPELFERLRGRGVKGPHHWNRYWEIYDGAVEIFGRDKAGVHLICGLGETEAELAGAIQRAKDRGGYTHLFSFFPEGQTGLALHPQPPLGVYRRIQVARYLIDQGLGRAEGFAYDDQGRIVDFGLREEALEEVLATGQVFMTSGCPGETFVAACNRPFANERPGPEIRNFPFPPNREDLAGCRAQLFSDLEGEEPLGTAGEEKRAGSGVR